MPRRGALSVCYRRTHSRIADKDPKHVPQSAQQSLLETACSVREEVVEHRKGGNLPSRLFPVPSPHLASLEPRDGGSLRWPEPRACLGRLGSWGLSNLGKVQAGEGWGGGAI